MTAPALPSLLGFVFDDDTVHISVPLPATGWRDVMRRLLTDVGPNHLFDFGEGSADEAYIRHACLRLLGARLVPRRQFELFLRQRRVAVEFDDSRACRVWDPRTGRGLWSGSLYTLFDELCPDVPLPTPPAPAPEEGQP